MYIAAYISKDEKGMGELLKQVSKECGDYDIKSKLRKLGSVFLNNREVSAQEAAMRILSIPMKKWVDQLRLSTQILSQTVLPFWNQELF